MIEENTHGAAGKSKDNAVSSLDFHHSISNDSIMDFGFLQFYEDEIDQSSDSAPTISTNEVNYS